MSLKPSVQIGDIFTSNQGSKAIVVGYETNKKVLIEYLDKYKHRMFVNASHLKKGQFKNPYHPNTSGVGYIGVGNYLASINKVHTPSYRAWCNMLQRCYGKHYQERNPTYIGCTVCDEWHNFQNFAEWYTSQPNYGKGFDLDKDLLVDGNTLYSPETCLLVPSEINYLLLDRAAGRGKYPIGVSYNSRDCNYQVVMSIDNKAKRIGGFKSIDDASKAYMTAKKEYVKQKALEWKDHIDEKLFKALMAKTA